MDTLSSFIPIDRRLALAVGRPLPEQATGAVLFADLAGFTARAEALAATLGPQHGAEELTRQLNAVYEPLVTTVHAHGGSVVSFSGDAITCWFAGDPGGCATACGLALQAAMPASHVPASAQDAPLRLKVGVATGPIRRLQIGDPAHQVLDVLAGTTLDRAVAAEHQAARGEVVVDAATATALGDRLVIAAWRARAGGGRVAVVARLTQPAVCAPWPPPARALLPAEVQPWLQAAVAARLRSGPDAFLADLRPVVPLFLRFGGLAYDRDPAAGPLLDAYIRWVQEVLAGYDGTLLEVILGDKGSYLYAAFGAPQAHDDDAERAVAAAHTLQTPPPALAGLPPPQIGLGQGRLYVGAYGATARRSYGVLGDAVNVAARLMEAAAPGQILVSATVARIVARRYRVDRYGPLRLKGRHSPVRVWRLDGPRPVAAPARRRDAGSLLGRSAELARGEAMLRAVRAGDGQVLRLEGPAGIGKSRLVAALSARARRQGLQVVVGTCASTAQTRAYTPWSEALHALLAGAAGSLEPAALAGWLGNHDPEWPVLLPLLGDLLGQPWPETPATAALDPPGRRRALFTLVVALLGRLAGRQPLLLVLEDAHWIDEASLALVLTLARALAGRPLGLVLVYRAPQAGTPGLPAGILAVPGPHLLLDELAPAPSQALVARRLGGPVSARLLALIETRAGGNPFYIEELVAALRDVRRLRCAADGTWDLAGGDGAAGAVPDVPDSLQGLVLARLDSLPEAPKLALKVASVVGRTFARETLAAAHPGPARGATLEAELALLVAREFVQPEPGDGNYRFTHSLTQEVVYSTLLAAQRRRLHRAVATWYEAGSAAAGAAGAPDPRAPLYPVLAYHWGRAEEPAREREYASRAGEQAAAQGAGEEALAYLTRALTLTPAADSAGRYRLLLAREAVYHLRGMRAPQAADLAALAALAADDAGRQATVAVRQALCAEVLGDYPGAVEAAQRAVAAAQAAGAPALETEGYLRWGFARWRQAAFAEARALFGAALAGARAQENRGQEAQSLRSLGQVDFYQGDYAAALAHTEQARALFGAQGDRQGEARTVNTLGAIRYQLGDLPAARALYQAASRVYRAVGDRRGEALVLDNLGMVAADLAEYETARDLFAQALPLYQEIGDRQMEAGALDSRGMLYYRLGDYAAAERDCTAALAIRRAIGQRNGEAYTLGSLALIAQALGAYAAAAELGTAAVDLGRALGARAFLGPGLLALGHARLGLGDLAGAAAAYDEAREVEEALGHAGLAQEAQAGLAAVALRRGALDDAQARAETVLTWVARHGPATLGEPFRVYATCYAVLIASAAPERAAAVRAAATALLEERAAGLTDARLQAQFRATAEARLFG